MNLYQIDSEMQAILTDGVDPDTGELLPEALEKIDALQIERTRKLENIACAIKNLRADAVAYKEEERVFAERRKAAEKKAERLSDFLSRQLDGEKFQTDRAVVSFRKSAAVNIENNVLAISFLSRQYPDCLRVKEPEVDKTAVKRLISAGVEVPGIVMEERSSMTVK